MVFDTTKTVITVSLKNDQNIHILYRDGKVELGIVTTNYLYASIFNFSLPYYEPKKNKIFFDFFKGTSMMERLMNCEVYQKNSITKQYNSSYVVQLMNNYRSHPGIIGIADRLFYEDKLKCLGHADSLFETVQFYNFSGEEQKSYSSYR